MVDNNHGIEQASLEHKQSRFSAIWIIPLVAIALGLWMIVQNYRNEGPEVIVRFATAAGLEAGRTRVRRLSVSLGVVERIYLNEGHKDVSAVLKLDRDAENMLREDTRFWVVRPRVGSGGVSGLSTLFSGAYVELDPGMGEPGKRQFRGMDTVPVTPQSAPGVHLTLLAEEAGSFAVYSPVLYNGYKVGQVEEATLDADGSMHYQIFVEAPYDDLVNTNTRFWNASGLRLETGNGGISLQTASLEALLGGGVEFQTDTLTGPGSAVEDGQEFKLYSSQSAISEKNYFYAREFILLFSQSVRGLKVGASIEYRGIRVGTVSRIDFSPSTLNGKLGDAIETPIPVVIKLEPGRLESDDEKSLAGLDNYMEEAIEHGMYASLATSNMLTGELFVSLDYHDKGVQENTDAPAVFAGLKVIPTIDAGLGRLQVQLSNFLAKLQDLELQEAVSAAGLAMNSISGAAEQADETIHNFSTLLESQDLKALPADLRAAVTQLDDTLTGLSPTAPVYTDLQRALRRLQVALDNIGELTEALKERPNSLIFSSSPAADLQPGSKR